MRQAQGTTTFIGFESNNNSIFLRHHELRKDLEDFEMLRVMGNLLINLVA